MMGIETIQQQARDAAIEAAESNAVPFNYGVMEVNGFETFPFPFLGDYVPDGWEEVDRHFVDSSGYGYDNEPALTANQFRELVKSRIALDIDVGWAIVQAGQFQVYVGEFKKTDGPKF